MPDDEVETKVFGIPIRAKGVNGIAMGIMALALGVSMFLLYDRTKQSEQHLDSISQSHAIARERQTHQTTSEHTAIVEALKSIDTGITEQNYIILSDEQEKREIKRGLRRPPSLSRKLER